MREMFSKSNSMMIFQWPMPSKVTMAGKSISYVKNTLGVGGENKASAKISTCFLCNLSFLSGYTQLRDHLIRNLTGLASWREFEMVECEDNQEILMTSLFITV